MNKAMSHQEILQKAIQVAVKNGWQYRSLPGVLMATIAHTSVANYPAFPALIFDHGFAKALWGESKPMTAQETKAAGYSGFGGGTLHDIDWKYHLQQMVIADDPIKYLGEHI